MSLARLIARRLALGVVTLVAVSVIVFAGTQLLPGDVAEAVLGQSATPDALAAMRTQLGLERPAYVRYGSWLIGVLHGDFGTSLGSGRSINELIASRLPHTVMLGLCAAAIGIPLAVLLGLLAASRAGKASDRAITAGALFVASGPEFLFATLLVIIFAVRLRLFPATSYVSEGTGFESQARALALPVLTLVLAILAPTTRMTRSAVLNVLGRPYIEMALLKGLSRRRILLAHALPNAIGPIVTVICISLGYLVSGVVVVEVIFSYSGMAKLMVDGIATRDYPLIQACALVFCAIYVLLNLIADLATIASTPRLRHGS